MREIKFRYWDGEYMIKQAYISQNGPVDSVGNGIDTGNGVLLQYTGLKDKNGKEIYEGDFLKNEYNTLTLVEWWDSGTFGQKEIPPRDIIDGWLYSFNDDYYNLIKKVVVGNIYENPELLGE